MFSFFSRNPRASTIRSLYGTIVAQARHPAFYREYGVDDTVNGRFEMLVLHLALFLDRAEGDARLRAAGQAVFDLFCTEMDDHMREAGIGDLKVPKEMHKVGEAFYGRRAAYREALAQAGESALVAALARNVYSGAPGRQDQALRLARYVRLAAVAPANGPEIAGGVAWPDPASA